MPETTLNELEVAQEKLREVGLIFDISLGPPRLHIVGGLEGLRPDTQPLRIRSYNKSFGVWSDSGGGFSGGVVAWEPFPYVHLAANTLSEIVDQVVKIYNLRLKVERGPMTDEELIGYCEIHCETERALFSGSQINRMYALAGVDGERLSLRVDAFYSMHEDMKELCLKARKRIKDKADTAIRFDRKPVV